MSGQKKGNGDKVPLLVRIDKQTDKLLREFIAAKYKHYEKGLLSFEVEQAILNWVALHTNAQKPSQRDLNVALNIPNPHPRVLQVWWQVKAWFEKRYGDSLSRGAHLSVKLLREAIAAVRGNDERTIRKWIGEFHRYGLIKPINNVYTVWEVL